MDKINETVAQAYIFQCKVNSMANSLEVLIDYFLRIRGVEPKGSFRNRIDLLKKLDLLNLDKLIGYLYWMDDLWTIVKHGNIIGGTSEVAFLKDEKIHSFSNQEQVDIEAKFSNQIMLEALRVLRI
ncbi:hypothetical protein COU58_02590 [Candidatus Pacearchaeota archaeon CG10_big_fil_rev_8_21_14_0_10_32_42]|nr:MAG: hypothetical protein COU58_02590 [Candidatus Pacearchaeota archaeon CG10_big_fil_rev_8_21_14_0_10_32_42]